MKSWGNIIWMSLLLCLLMTGCSERQELTEGNAVYFWRTDLRLDSTEWTFLQRYHINKVYCRYFDVVIDEEGAEPKPNATIGFSSTLPDSIELIPTIYITEDCMHQAHQGLAENWGQTLSTTIRLHQLSMEAPPVDYGVLMIYNTGDPRKWEERNPILDIRDVQPYLKRLDSYPLPLAAAYPVYQWVRMIRNIRIEHTVGADEILRVKEAVEKERSSLKNVIVTYHLDKDNINRYKPETYEEIYHH